MVGDLTKWYTVDEEGLLNSKLEPLSPWDGFKTKKSKKAVADNVSSFIDESDESPPKSPHKNCEGFKKSPHKNCEGFKKSPHKNCEGSAKASTKIVNVYSKTLTNKEQEQTTGISADAEFPSPPSSRCSSGGCESSPPFELQNFSTEQPSKENSPRNSSTIKAGHLATYTERFKKTGSALALEKVWKITVADKLGAEHFIAFTARDKKNAKSDLTKWCESSSIDPVKFMVWAITSWGDIQAILKWAKLPDTPTFQQFFGLKDKFAVLYKQLCKKEKSGTVRRVYNSPAEVPENHPRRVEFLKNFKLGVKTIALEEEA